VTGPGSATPDSNQVELLAAALRRDSQDLSLYAGFLLNQLSGALPPELIVVERERSMRERLAGKDGRVVEVRITIDDRTWSLRREAVGKAAVATVAHEVNGIVLSRETVPLDAWAGQVAAAVVARATASGRSATELEQMFRPTTLD
jgi:hypothetical protein